MIKKKQVSAGSVVRRKLAEELLKGRPPGPVDTANDAQTYKLIHELEVHQVELEMQNEELQFAEEKAQHSAKQLADLYEEIFEFSPAGYFTLNHSGIILELNLSGAKMLGMDRSALKNCHFYSFVSLDSGQTFHDFLRKIFDTREKQTCEVRFSASENEPIFLHLEGTVSQTEEKCLLTAVDISARKLAEEALLNSEEKFRKSFMSHPDILFITTLSDGIYLDVNKSFTEILGWDHDEVIGKTAGESDIYINESDRGVLYRVIVSNGNIRNHSISFRTRAGVVHKGLFSAETIEMEGQKCILARINDITERIQAEETLHESEEKLRFLFENMSQGAFYQLADGTLTDINPAGLEMFGLSGELFIGKDSYKPEWKVVDEQLNPLPPEQHPSMQALAQGIQINREVGVFNPLNGEYRWLIVNARPQFKRGNRKPSQVFVTMHDITERKQREAINSSRLHLIQYSNEHTLDELLEEILNVAEKLTGSLIGFIHFIEDDQQTLTLQNWSSRTKAEFCKPEFKGMHYPVSEAGVWVDCILKRKAVIHNDYASLPHRKGLPEGHALLVREMLVPIFTGEKISAVLGVGNKSVDYTLQDIETVTLLGNLAWEIAQRKQSEEALVNASIQWQTTFDGVHDSICLLDNSHRILRSNKEMNLRFPVHAGNMAGKHCWEIVHGTNLPCAECPLMHIMHTMQRQSVEQEIDGKWYEIIVDPFFDGNNKMTGAVHIVRDINKRKLAETALKESEMRLRELNITRDKFFSIIAHDLKSPFNNIVGFSNLLVEQIKEHEYIEVQEFAEIIREASRQAMDLLINLLEWSRLQTGSLQFRSEQVDIIPLIRESRELLKASALQKEISISCNLPDTLIVSADSSMLGTILRNLISNAIKFTNTGGWITVSATQSKDELVVSVTDSGVGISKNSINKLFRIEESVSTKGTRDEKGTGLGLLLCKEFVEKHGGRIWVESEPGKGSSFYFTIPYL